MSFQSYSFNAGSFRTLLHAAVEPLLKTNDESEGDASDPNSPRYIVSAMDQAIDVMERADSDDAVRNSMSRESLGMLEDRDITQIGEYALGLLEALVALLQEKNGKQDRELLRLSIPISMWVISHGGKLNQIDMLVNSLASFANELSDTHALAELAAAIATVIEHCDDEIKRDLEQTNMMRPWRILNLNYGIVATRSHQPELIEKAYDTLIKNLPQDARQFFKEGMQQMDIVGYPDEVREVVKRYNTMWGSESRLH